jgi:hypothetical protein
MQWCDVKCWQEPDAQRNVVWRGRWSKPTTKTDLPHTIPLPSGLVARLQQLDRTSDWIFPGDQRHCRRASLALSVMRRFIRRGCVSEAGST